MNARTMPHHLNLFVALAAWIAAALGNGIARWSVRMDAEPLRFRHRMGAWEAIVCVHGDAAARRMKKADAKGGGAEEDTENPPQIMSENG